jgi:hypothetical protein
MRHIALTAALLLAASAPATVLADECVPPALDEPVAALARTDHAASGNRIVAGCGPLTGDVVDVQLTGTPTWVLPDPSDRGGSWFVVLEDGTVDHVTIDDGGAAFVRQTETPPLVPGQAPLALAMGEDGVVVGSALGASAWFADPLPDTRATEISGAALVALTAPTDRYDHGVLGDAIEAAAVEVLDGSGRLTRIEVGRDEVIEGISAMVVQMRPDDSGQALVVTISDAADGARLRAYSLDGEIVAESAPIGQGYRWLHQIGAGRLAVDGELEIIAVRTPHIGGIVEAYRRDDDRLELVASVPGYSSHQLGSPNLDMALLADTDGDGRLDVLVPTQSMTELASLARTEKGFEEIDRLTLDGRLTTNVAATPTADGGLALAVGTDDGRLRVFR